VKSHKGRTHKEPNHDGHRRHGAQPSSAAQPNEHTERGSRVRRFFAHLGPGLITGAADDDPSGISTYSVAGASFGYGALWTALFSFPLMAAVQVMCARLGMVTGRGLAGVVRRRYSRWVLWGTCTLVVVANVINIGADLAGMAEATQMVTHVSSKLWTPFFTIVIVSFLFFTDYEHIARIFKWLTLVLFSYVIAALLAHPNVAMTFRATFIPHVEWTRDFLATFVGILGTTISPYLFFWQAAQEVEEERRRGRRAVGQRRGATDEELRRSFIDVVAGMFFSNFVMYFIILTTAVTLHAHGKTNISTAQEAAGALRPLAGDAAYWLFTLGIIGTGMLGVPILAGACAFAIGEASAWRATLSDAPRHGPRFYAVIGVSMLIGLALDFFGFNAVSMLFWSAVVNGVLAPPLIVVVVLLTSDPKVMGDRVSPPLLRWLGWVTAVTMTFAAAAMFWTWNS
jgi:NRAMP (natural resistance-associated macrophage protein)-like metal ion transporter